MGPAIFLSVNYKFSDVQWVALCKSGILESSQPDSGTGNLSSDISDVEFRGGEADH